MSTDSTLANFKNLLDKSEITNTEVSAWSVGQHIEHCCQAANGIAEELKSSTRGAKTPSIHLLRTLVFMVGKIPRGKGKAPKSVIPSEVIPRAELAEKIEQTEVQLLNLMALPKDHWWEHPVFGVLNTQQARKFILIHNRHHLKIIEDILKHLDT